MYLELQGTGNVQCPLRTLHIKKKGNVMVSNLEREIKELSTNSSLVITFNFAQIHLGKV